jgi:dihydrofolate synthase/folylpolyglutamate synthase
MNIDDALDYLDRHTNLEASAGKIEGLSLDHMRRLMEVLGDPHRAFPVIHITGTNGKGSVARMITALLVESGLSVGTYTSPHLETLNERIAWNGDPIGAEALAEAISDVAAIEPVSGINPSWFELVTAAALAWFALVAVDVAVVEVGLLGEYDATNVVDADVAVITNIGFDHTDGVGDWRRAVATEKAGIVKEGSFLVLGEADEDLRSVFLARNPRQTWERGVDFGIDQDLPAVGGRLIDVHTPLGSLEQVFVPVHGAHQAANAVLAIAVAEAFFGRAIDQDVADQAFAGLTIPGRLEVMGRGPLVLVDGAHNPAGAQAAAETIAEDFEVSGRRTLVVGLLAGRDPSDMLEALDVAGYDLVVTCTAPSPRGVPSAEVATVAAGLGAVVEEGGSVADAIDRALAVSGPEDLVLVTGSLYVVGAARPHLRLRAEAGGDDRDGISDDEPVFDRETGLEVDDDC